MAITANTSDQFRELGHRPNIMRAMAIRADGRSIIPARNRLFVQTMLQSIHLVSVAVDAEGDRFEGVLTLISGRGATVREAIFRMTIDTPQLPALAVHAVN